MWSWWLPGSSPWGTAGCSGWAPGLTVVVLERNRRSARTRAAGIPGDPRGVYYQPGSERRGCARRDARRWCSTAVITASTTQSAARSWSRPTRRSGAAWSISNGVARPNGVRTEMLEPGGLRELEPHVAGVAALHVLDTGIVDYADVCRALAAEIGQAGASHPAGQRGALRVASRRRDSWSTPRAGRSRRNGWSRVPVSTPTRSARAVSGPRAAGGMRVIAFRGEYRELVPTRAHLVRGLVYPVPDPQLPVPRRAPHAGHRRPRARRSERRARVRA